MVVPEAAFLIKKWQKIKNPKKYQKLFSQKYFPGEKLLHTLLVITPHPGADPRIKGWLGPSTPCIWLPYKVPDIPVGKL